SSTTTRRTKLASSSWNAVTGQPTTGWAYYSTAGIVLSGERRVVKRDAALLKSTRNGVLLNEQNVIYNNCLLAFPYNFAKVGVASSSLVSRSNFSSWSKAHAS